MKQAEQPSLFDEPPQDQPPGLAVLPQDEPSAPEPPMSTERQGTPYAWLEAYVAGTR